MKEFKVLPTDDRFKNLTDEQFEMIFQQYMIDIEELKLAQKRKGKKNPAINDPDFDESDFGDDEEIYSDPDFDDAWNADDEEELDDIGNIDENSSPEDFQSKPLDDKEGEIPLEDEWEEVD